MGGRGSTEQKWVDSIRAVRDALAAQTDPEGLIEALQTGLSGVPGVVVSSELGPAYASSPAGESDENAGRGSPPRAGGAPAVRLAEGAAWSPERELVIETLMAFFEARYAALAAEPADTVLQPTQGVVLDVTERNRADQAHRLSAERFRSLMQQTYEGFYLVEFAEPVPIDAPAEAQVDQFYRDGTVVECNDAFARMYGFERAEQIVGRRLIELHGGADNPQNRDFLKLCVESDYRVHGQVSEEVDAEGNPLWVSNDILGIVEGRHLLRVWGTQTDVTNIKRAEGERERLQAQLAQAQKLESLGRLAGGVAHDLNNLLTPIIGYGELLREELPPELGLHGMLDESVQASFRARDLVQQLLAFGRRQPLEVGPVDLGEVVAGFASLLRRTIPEDIEFRIERSRVEPVSADVGQIEQVLMNLVSNAADAMPEGGTLTIETRVEELDEGTSRHHAEVPPGRYAMLAVTDTGEGMDDETKSRAFEPFFTTKGELGTGLGLATVYGIVGQHRGFVWVDSEPGRGASFKVYLPTTAEVVSARRSARPASAKLSGSERILLVEDDRAVRDLTSAILDRLGYQSVVVSSGAEAIACLEAGPEPDLLLADVVMPRMNGRQLQEAVAARWPRVKTLFMSGYTDDIIAGRGVLNDGMHYIQKPFTLRGLGRKLREVLDPKGPPA